MKNLASIVIAVIALLALSVSGYLYFHRTSESPQNFGAVPSLQNPVCVNGVCEYFLSSPFRTATSTLCDLKTPNATTSVRSAIAFIAHPAPYAQTYVLGYSATANATSSNLVASWTIGANATSTVVATTTATAPVDTLFNPNTHIVFNLSTSTATGASVATGYCEAILFSVNGL